MGAIGGLWSVSPTIMEKMKAQKQDVESIEDETVFAYIDKAWAGIAYTLVGQLGQRENILSEIINPNEYFLIREDVYMSEYINYSTPERVKQIHEKVKVITREEFWDLFSKRNFQEVGIYVGDSEDTNKEHFEYFYENFLKIQKLFEYAAANDEFIVVKID